MLDKVTAGDVPNSFNVIIEIPSNSQPVKYEVDKASGILFVDRFMATAMHYPCEYGFIPKTLSNDGDPTDVLVLCPLPLLPGSVVKVRPIGVLKMTDEAGADAKVLAVPINKITTAYSKINNIHDVEKYVLDRISHFFAHYKDLEAGKWVKIDGWFDIDEAKKELVESIERYNQTNK